MPSTTRNPQYLKTQDGQIRSVHSNVLLCLRVHDVWAGKIGYNELSKQTIVQSAPWDPTRRLWCDEDDIQLIDWLYRHEGMSIHSPKIISDCVNAVAAEHSYHPVRDYLNGLEWDGEDRLDGWLESYLGCQPNETQSRKYLAAVGRCVLISAVARAYKPGCKVDTCMIMEGGQGKFKSTAVRTLAGDWFTDDLGDIGTKDAAMQLQTWIVELSELNAVRRAEAPHLKAFLSRQIDRFRPPFGRHIREFPRPGIFIGTVNPSEYLIDDTGARRFWPVETGHIHIGWLAEDRDQLWAEARSRYMAGDPWWFDAGEREELAVPMEQSKRVVDPWEQRVLEYAAGFLLNGTPYVTLADILTYGIHLNLGQIDQKAQNRVSGILRSNGYTKKRLRRPTGLVWAYYPPEQ